MSSFHIIYDTTLSITIIALLSGLYNQKYHHFEMKNPSADALKRKVFAEGFGE